jgi:hypothetical protein
MRWWYIERKRLMNDCFTMPISRMLIGASLRRPSASWLEMILSTKLEKKEGSKTEGFYFDVKRMLEIGRQKGYDE